MADSKKSTKKAEKEEKPVEAEEKIVEETTEEVVEEAKEEKNEKIAKAGKRSAKAVREAEEEEARLERKAKVEAGEIDPSEQGEKKGPVPVTRPKIERRSKNYRKSVESFDQTKEYGLKEALDLANKTSTVKFDPTVEIHMNLGVDPRQADQNIRDSLVLPEGTGKTVRVAVFAPADMHDAAKKAGADIVGEDDFLEQLKKEVIDFDVLISTPNVMAQLGRYAKLLGPKGLMPNPKSGTVTKDVANAVKEAKAGRVEYRVDSYGIVHMGIGKLSFGTDKLLKNAEAVIASVKGNKPASSKGVYLQKITVTTSMGPSITVAL